MDEALHLRIAYVRQLTYDAIDARMAIAAGVPLRQTKFNFHVRHEVFEFRNDFGYALIQCPEVGVEDVHSIVHLRR